MPLRIFAAFLAAALLASAPAMADAPKRIDIPAGDLASALAALAKQSGVELMYSSEQVKGLRTAGVSGEYTAATAAVQLLKGTNLKLKVHERGGLLISDGNARNDGPDGAFAVRLVRAGYEDSGPSARETAESTGEDPLKGIPEVLVKGSRSLNRDIKRSEDATQPYVVFDSQELQRSQATNLEDFLRTRLPMNTMAGSTSQENPGSVNTTSTVNLRGLGTNQTLILVDGRRLPGTGFGGTPAQPDINGIPIGAIERIEVLPSTAGGIYGGSATGGVVNIVLRRDFRGVEVTAAYGNTFDSDATARRVDMGAGFNLEGGRTRVMIGGAYSDTNTLTMGDRNFLRKGRALLLANNPNALLGVTTPPLGATANIRSVSGTLTLDPAYGGASLGSAITHLPLGYAGAASDNGAALIANAGTFNLDLANDMNGAAAGLYAAPSTRSASLNIRREFGASLEMFLDLSRLDNDGRSLGASVPNSVTNLPATAPNNPFQQNIRVRFPTPNLSFDRYSESSSARGTAGFIARLPRQWTAGADYTWSRWRFRQVRTVSAVDAAAATSLGSGLPAANGRPALNALQEGNTYPIDFTPYLLPSPNDFLGPFDTVLKDAVLHLSGPVLSLPGGDLRLSLSTERRKETIEDGFIESINTTTRAPTYTFYPPRSQEVQSYYLEAVTPLISSANALRGVRELELQASVRRDEYETRSVPSSADVSVPSRDGPFPPLNYSTNRLASTDYTLGLKYVPLQDLAFRASFGTGFLPPTVAQIASTQTPFSFSSGTDPKRGGTDMYVGTAYTMVNGGNPNLQPEQSRSWSAGVILTPRFAPDLRLSIDYTHIDKVDEIKTPEGQVIINNEDFLPGRVVRGANLPGDPLGWAGPIILLDITTLNLAETSVEAYDFQVDYTFHAAALGEFHGYALATWQPHLRNRLLPADPFADLAGFRDGPLKWRGNFGLDWQRGPLTLGWNAQYYDSYRFAFADPRLVSVNASQILNQGSDSIPSQMYHDVRLAYRFDGAVRFVGGWLAGSEIALGVQNVLDKNPPTIFAVASGGYSTYGDPRLRRFTLSLRKSFGKT